MTKKKRTIAICVALAGVSLTMIIASAIAANDTYDLKICESSAADPKAGIPACTRLLESKQTSIDLVDVYISRGSGWNVWSRFDAAIDDFSEAIARKPDLYVAYYYRAMAWRGKGNLDKALDDLSQAIRIKPDFAAALNGRGAILLEKGQYDSAIINFDEAIRVEPNDANAYVNRGLALQAIRELGRALLDFERAIRLFSDPAQKASAISQRAIVWIDKGEIDKAIVDYDTAISLDPENAQRYSERGEAFRLKGDIVGALKDDDKALYLNPMSVPSLIRRALAWRDKHELDRAIADCSKATTLDQNNAMAHADCGDIWRLKGNFNQAIVDLETAVALDPTNPVYHVLRGETWRDAGNLQDALNELSEVLRHRPEDVAALTARGLTFEKMGMAEQARTDFEKAANLPTDRNPSMDRPAQDTARRRINAKFLGGDAKLFDGDVTSNASSVVVEAGRRIALVLGMGAYANVPPLTNPVRDAHAIADVFRRLGFAEVIERPNLKRAEMEDALKDFGDKAADADWAVIYYAGHGVEMEGVNYLVPIDAKLARGEHVEDETVTLSRLLSKAKPARQLRLVILDACRNNPFPMTSAAGRSRAVGRGLSRVEPSSGVLVAYAARDGSTADDGDGAHSPYTQALLTYLEKPGLDIRIMFSKVRDLVLRQTDNKQEPFTYGSLPGEELFFKQATR
jgi:tetratricopeptide (TPR) repeat protein